MSAKAWLQTLLLAFLAGVLLEYHWLVYFSVAVAMVMGVAHLWRNHALRGLRYTRRFLYTRGFPGEESDVRISAENTRLLPAAWLRAVDAWPLAVGPADEDQLVAVDHGQGLLINLFSLRWKERIQRVFRLRFRARGIYTVGPVNLEAGDPFGLYSQREEAPDGSAGAAQTLVVYPEILPLEQLRRSAENPFGDLRSSKPLFEDPTRTIGARPYRPEDGLRRIHWPATARSGDLQSRIYQPVTTRVVMLCLNVTTEEKAWLGFRSDVLEQMVKICATLANYGIETGDSVGLLSNGYLAQSDQSFRVAPGRSPNQLSALLTALAGVTPYSNTSFIQYLLRSMTDVPFGARLVIVTAQLQPALQDTLLRLRRYRPNLTVYSLDPDGPDSLPGVRVIPRARDPQQRAASLRPLPWKGKPHAG